MGDRAFETLLAACAGDEDVEKLVLLSREDVDEAADQAVRARLGHRAACADAAQADGSRLVAQVAEKMQAWKAEDDP